MGKFYNKPLLRTSAQAKANASFPPADHITEVTGGLEVSSIDTDLFATWIGFGSSDIAALWAKAMNKLKAGLLDDTWSVWGGFFPTQRYFTGLDAFGRLNWVSFYDIEDDPWHDITHYYDLSDWALYNKNASQPCLTSNDTTKLVNIIDNTVTLNCTYNLFDFGVNSGLRWVSLFVYLLDAQGNIASYTPIASYPGLTLKDQSSASLSLSLPFEYHYTSARNVRVCVVGVTPQGYLSMPSGQFDCAITVPNGWTPPTPPATPTWVQVNSANVYINLAANALGSFSGFNMTSIKVWYDSTGTAVEFEILGIKPLPRTADQEYPQTFTLKVTSADNTNGVQIAASNSFEDKNEIWSLQRQSLPVPANSATDTVNFTLELTT